MPVFVRRLLIALLLVALVLPIAMCVLLGVAYLLAALDDAAGASGARYAGLGLGILWVVDLVLLLVAHVVATLISSERHDEQE